MKIFILFLESQRSICPCSPRATTIFLWDDVRLCVAKVFNIFFLKTKLFPLKLCGICLSFHCIRFDQSMESCLFPTICSSVPKGVEIVFVVLVCYDFALFHQFLTRTVVVLAAAAAVLLVARCFVDENHHQQRQHHHHHSYQRRRLRRRLIALCLVCCLS